MGLSKLHVRYIQTQNNFFVTTPSIKEKKFNIKMLYIRNANSFYLINNDEPIEGATTLTLNFKHKNEYMDTFECVTTTNIVEKGSEEFETALLFFHQDASKVKQILLLNL